MTLFELVKATLDELYNQGCEEHGSDIDEVVLEKIKYLSKNYGNLTGEYREPLEYRDTATRIAYVYSYVAAHADYVVQILEKARDKKESSVFNGETIRISCLGGGPGSEILATLKYLSENSEIEPVKKVICYLLDGEQAWADTWSELDDSICGDLNLKANFQPLNVTDPESWKHQKNFRNADLFTLSYFVSEVFKVDKDGAAKKFFEELIHDAKPGALFLYVDNGHDEFNGYFDSLYETAGLNCLLKATNVRKTPRFNEQAEALKEYSDKFGRSPKIQSFLSYRLLEKPHA